MIFVRYKCIVRLIIANIQSLEKLKNEKGKEKRSVTTPLGKILRGWKTLMGKCQKPKLAQLAVK